MIPGSFPLNIYAGDTSTWRFTLWRDAAKTDPVDLTGVAVKAEIRLRSGAPALVALQLIVTLPNVIDALLDSDTSREVPASARWDLQLTDAAGHISTILAGPVKVVGDITDSPVSSRAASGADGPPVEQVRVGYASLLEPAP
jgi:hypothetical protein